MHKLFLVLLMTACTGIPKGISAIDGFELQRYLGTWYEIARLEHSFEEGLDSVSATYSLRDDGGVKVVNQGRNSKSGAWDKAEGKAYFVESPDIGRLRVSFFGPFYGGYNIIALDKQNYNYAMIAGPDTDYLWILARTPKLPDDILKRLISQAKASGFATEQLIFVKHPASIANSPQASKI